MKKRITFVVIILIIFAVMTVEALSVEQLNQNIVDTGIGLYQDEYENDRYIFRGYNPHNFIMFNNDLWRIVSLESDGSLKITRYRYLEERRPYDDKNNRTTGYCSLAINGCNAWSSISDYSFSGKSGVVEEDSSLNTYLNNDYYNSLSEEAKNLIINHDFSIGGVSYNDDIQNIINSEKKYKWNGKIGLLTVSEYRIADGDICDERYNDRCESNYLNFPFFPYGEGYHGYYWLITPLYDSKYYLSNETVAVVTTEYPRYLSSTFASDYNEGNVNYSDMDYPNNSGAIRPVVYLTKDINIVKGVGTEEDPYIIEKVIGEEIGNEDVNIPTEDEDNTITEVIDVPNTSSKVPSIILEISSLLMIIGVIILYKAKVIR